MLVHCRSLPHNFVRFPQQFASTHLYTWVERGTVRVKRLAQEHNTMSPARSFFVQSSWMPLSRVTRFRFFIYPYLFPKLTMPLFVATVLLCLKLLMTYSSKNFFALRTLLTRSPFLLACSTGLQRLILDLRHVNAFIYKQTFDCADLIWRQVTIILKFSQSSENTSHLLGILVRGSSDTFNFAFFRLAFLLLLLSSLRFSNRFSFFHFPGRWPRRGDW